MYAICDMDGETLREVEHWTLDETVRDAVAMLEDDTELRELTVWAVHPSGNLITHLRTVTFGPDADWQSVVVVLKPGEHVRAPGPIPHRISEEDLDGYSLDDPKRWSMEQRLGEWS